MHVSVCMLCMHACMYVIHACLHVSCILCMHVCGHQAKESNVSYACIWAPNKGKWCLICIHACGHLNKLVFPMRNLPKNICASKSGTLWPSQTCALCLFYTYPHRPKSLKQLKQPLLVDTYPSLGSRHFEWWLTTLTSNFIHFELSMAKTILVGVGALTSNFSHFELSMVKTILVGPLHCLGTNQINNSIQCLFQWMRTPFLLEDSTCLSPQSIPFIVHFYACFGSLDHVKLSYIYEAL